MTLTVPRTSVAVLADGSAYVHHDLGDAGRTVAAGPERRREQDGERGAIVAAPAGGYWIVAAGGAIHPHRGAPLLGGGRLTAGTRSLRADREIVAATTSGACGVFAVSADGVVYGAGTAMLHGDVFGLAAAPAGIAATPSGRGYVIVDERGAVYCFGDARYAGAAGPAAAGRFTGVAAHAGGGYWLISAEGTLLAFGGAPFLGAPEPGTQPVTDLTATLDGTRYAWVRAGGQVGRSCAAPRRAVPTGNLQ